MSPEAWQAAEEIDEELGEDGLARNPDDWKAHGARPFDYLAPEG